MNATNLQTASPPASLSRLSSIELVSSYAEMWKAGSETVGGHASWRGRKLAEFREFLALCQVSQRIVIHHFNLAESLKILFTLNVPVPCQMPGRRDVDVMPFAQVGLTYHEIAIRTPQPGYSFVQIVQPRFIWHSNVLFEGGQLCLGARLPAGIAVKELVLMTYGALSMQSVQLDVADPAGVLNPEAARFWINQRKRLPLSREPFLRPTKPPTNPLP